MNKKIILALSIVLLIIAGLVFWNKACSTTKIALVNFKPFQVTSIIKANTDNFVEYEEVTLEELDKLSSYDFVMGFGMGLNISEEQRNQILAATEKNVPVLIYAATTPENNICNLDSTTKEGVLSYLGSGNKQNYVNLSRYIRQHIDQKSFFVTAAEPAIEGVYNVLYHLDENKAFKTVAEYEDYLKKNGFYKENGKKVAIVGGMNDPFSGNRANIDSLITVFERSGLNVYPVASMMQRMDFLKEINPDAVIYFPHGRLSMGKPDAAIEWLKEKNIPIFAPLTILQPRNEWEKDKMGMFGGFLSQSVVMPELDGAIYPYVVNAQRVDKDGLYIFEAIPDRLRDFVQIVNNFISLKHKNNADKKVAIYYFKGAGQETLTAQGLETVPSLYNVLKHLKSNGYKVDNLPATVEEFGKMLATQGAVLGTYAEGAFDDFIKNGKPDLIEKSVYEKWVSNRIPKELYKDVVNMYGEAPGNYMAVNMNNNSYLAIARIVFGNIALLPQPMAGLGSDAFAIVHGAKSAPPHSYIGAYLWAENQFKADAMLHFGTHGSLEFTPQKQVALSSYDWSDRLVGTIPHFYYYTIANIGEGMIAKRRSYATTISYLTPPFMESNTRLQFKTLQDNIQKYYKADAGKQNVISLDIKKIAVQMGLHNELRLDSNMTKPYSMEDIGRIENFAEEIANEKMTGQLYTTGIPYESSKIHSSVMMMSAEPIAYSLAALDRQKGKVTDKQLKNNVFFTQHYLNPAKSLVNQVLNSKSVNDEFICSIAGISEKELIEAQMIMNPPKRGMMENMNNNSSKGETVSKNTPSGKMPATPLQEGNNSSKMPDNEAMKKMKTSGSGHPSWIPKVGEKPKNMNNNSSKGETVSKNTPSGKMPATPLQEGNANASNSPSRVKGWQMQSDGVVKEQKEKARAIVEVHKTINNIHNYKAYLEQSPKIELQSIINALNGGYITPTSGGDAVANPSALPTGRNLYAVNPEATPSEAAWEKGKDLVNATLAQYKKQHGKYPRKVSYTFWSSEFIESEGATIAQALYMLGVEPVRDMLGRVSDLRLIESKDLDRPRIDVVVQTSGQFRDLAASRLALISRAVEMAAVAKDDKHENYVNTSTIETERLLVEQGISPKEARELSTQRVFGGVNGMYGTGIQGMVLSGDRWEKEKEIADQYMQNMGAVYGSDKNWGNYNAGLLRAVLNSTDVVVQARQSNTWGALSLDHVYEFMGGMNLAIREVTGKEPEAYFADYRNRNNVKMQELKEAVGIESRSTIFNPEYIKEMMKGGASSASQVTGVVSNMYGWNVMKKELIDNGMWDKVYDIYVKDSFSLGTQKFFEAKNPAALQEVTAVMMETARKGLWKATDKQLKDIAKLHTDLVKQYGASGSAFSGNNVKLQNFIASNVNTQDAAQYKQQIKNMNTNSSSVANKNSKVLKKQEIRNTDQAEKSGSLNGVLIVSIVLALFVVAVVLVRRKRKQA